MGFAGWCRTIRVIVLVAESDEGDLATSSLAAPDSLRCGQDSEVALDLTPRSPAPAQPGG